MLIAYILLLMFCYLFDSNINYKHGLMQKERNLIGTFHIIFIIFLALVFALRHEGVGTDTETYLNSFENSKYRTYKDIFDFSDDDRSKEYFFYALTKFIRGYTDNPIIFFGVYGTLFALSYGIMLHKYSKNYMISYIVLLSLNLGFLISGMRQTAAMSIVMLSYPFIKNRKLIPFLICIMIAYFFHNSAIIFILIYPIAYKKLGKGHVIFLIICIALAYLFPGAANKILFDWLGWKKLQMYEDYEAQLTSSGFIIKACILVFNLFHYRDTIKNNPDNIILYNMSILGVGLQAFTVVMSQAFRMSVYFSIFDSVLIANVIQELSSSNEKSRRNKIVVYFGVLALLLFYYFAVSGAMVYETSVDIFG